MTTGGATSRPVLHLRVIAPTDLRGPVLNVLHGEPGVTHVVVHAGAAIDPAGDEITAGCGRSRQRCRRAAANP